MADGAAMIMRLLAPIAAIIAAALPASAVAAMANPAAVLRIQQDVEIAALSDRLAAVSRTGPIVIEHVALIDPQLGRAIPDRTVIVRDGRVAWVGPAADAPSVRSATRIDGRGRFLSPGLADMHVHTQGLGEHILRLAAGVTTVREMDGFPWMLRMRDAIAGGRSIGAYPYVAGTIIAGQPLSGYAVVVRTPDEARAVVRNQRACGYSFIKIHNRLSQPLLDAVADEARRAGLDLIGHVPHDISLRHAIQSAGIRTIEHLKGFLIDQTLFPSPEDFGAAMAGATLWVTPTLYTRLDRAYGAEAARRAADPRQRYVPRATREAWAREPVQPGSRDAQLYDRQLATQRSVIQRLLPLRPRWLAGTDAAGYRYNVAGFALHDEMAMMQQAGLSTADVVRAATSEAAAAMRAGNDFGRIAPGLRGDLLLLDANPLETLDAYRRPSAVIAQGRVFSRPVLDRALEAIARIYDALPAGEIDRAAAEALAERVEAHSRQGHVFESQALLAAAEALSAAGQRDAGARLTAAAALPTEGPCRAETPA